MAVGRWFWGQRRTCAVCYGESSCCLGIFPMAVHSLSELWPASTVSLVEIQGHKIFSGMWMACTWWPALLLISCKNYVFKWLPSCNWLQVVFTKHSNTSENLNLFELPFKSTPKNITKYSKQTPTRSHVQNAPLQHLNPPLLPLWKRQIPLHNEFGATLLPKYSQWQIIIPRKVLLGLLYLLWIFLRSPLVRMSELRWIILLMFGKHETKWMVFEVVRWRTQEIWKEYPSWWWAVLVMMVRIGKICPHGTLSLYSTQIPLGRHQKS